MPTHTPFYGFSAICAARTATLGRGGMCFHAGVGAHLRFADRLPVTDHHFGARSERKFLDGFVWMGHETHD